MMLVYDRYILRQMSVGMVLVTMGLIGVLWLTQSLHFIEITLNKGASIWVFLKLTLLLMPGFLTVILPVALFTVVLFTYNKLLTDRELVVLRAAGLSHWALARPALKLAGLSVLASLVLNLWIIPRTVAEFRDMQLALRNNLGGIVLQEGQFNQLGDGLTVYVASRNSDGELQGVIVHDERQPTRAVTVLAERGALMKNDEGQPQVLLINGTRRQVSQLNHRLSLLEFESYTVDFGSTRDRETGHRNPEAREMPLLDLFAAKTSVVGVVLQRLYRVEAHQRLSSPLYHIAFALLASACLLTGWFNRRGQADRVILAIGLMVLVQALALGVNNLAAKSLTMLPLMYLVPVLIAVGAGWCLSWTPRRRTKKDEAIPSEQGAGG